MGGNKVIGFACGVYDLFHAGHALMFKECAENCDFLIVALNKAENFDNYINPGKNKPTYSFEERKLILNSIKYIDEVIGYNSEEELEQILKEKKISLRFLGDDYRGKKITGEHIGIPIHYIDRSHGMSTSKYKSLLG
jgi:glycerol-3-phosphate cytidylyltransferase